MSFLDRAATIAPSGFNRWLVPPAALAVHLCIGQAYATSVYKTALVKHFGASLTEIGRAPDEEISPRQSQSLRN